VKRKQFYGVWFCFFATSQDWLEEHLLYCFKWDIQPQLCQSSRLHCLHCFTVITVCICVTGYASQHIWCLSQARIHWEGCVRKGILRKNGGDGRDGAPISLDGVAVHPDCWCVCLCYLHFAPENPEDGIMYLLVPAHPGCPRQSPHSHKMVVLCVCVCINVCMCRCYWNGLSRTAEENSKCVNCCQHAYTCS